MKVIIGNELVDLEMVTSIKKTETDLFLRVVGQRNSIWLSTYYSEADVKCSYKELQDAHANLLKLWSPNTLKFEKIL